MSRVGSAPVELPSGVTATIEGQRLTVKGSKGTETVDIHSDVTVAQVENALVFKPKRGKTPLWGTMQRLAKNAVHGVANGFTRNLEIQGVGFRAAVQGKQLVLNLGFSHEVKMDIPEGLQVAAPKPTELIVTGSNKQKVGHFAALIREHRKPEPYKGKGIRLMDSDDYDGEYVNRKEGKKK